MIHYHGLPITPDICALKAVKCGHAFVSFAHAGQLGLAIESCQSFAIDNGAFTAWTSGNTIADWQPFYDWALDVLRFANCDFAVIPDVIDGTEKDNDEMLKDCPLPVWSGAPVYHMHESLDRLERLVNTYPRIALGSSGDFSYVGDSRWWKRINEMMKVACYEDGRPKAKLHGLRMLDPAIFSILPLASADSTNIGRNIGIDKKWTGSYRPATKEGRTVVMRERIENFNGATRFEFGATQECLF